MSEPAWFGFPRFRFINHWKGFDDGFSFSPLVIWWLSNAHVLGWRRCMGISLFNFGFEFYWGRA